VSDASQRTEKPSPRRLKKARAEGKFVSSKELISGLQFLVFFTILTAFGPQWMANLKQASRTAIVGAFANDLTESRMTAILQELFRQTLVPVALSGCLLIVTGLAFQLASTRASLAWAKLAPSFKNFNPIAKLKNIPSQGIPNVLQAILLLAVFGTAIFWLLEKNAESLLLMPLASLSAGLNKMMALVTEVLWKAAALFLLFGVVDFFRQTRRFLKEMRMTKQEVRDELKESEVNPHIKMRIRRIQRDLRRRKMMADVPTATAVIVNPTHYAVAIRYRHQEMSTPMVVAKGKNYLALRIRQKAVEHQVPLIENPPLAQALYKSVEVGQEIPPHLYRAVAEILAYIYRLMGMKVK
jgi:flagellar biosynthesis protein FlhB